MHLLFTVRHYSIWISLFQLVKGSLSSSWLCKTPLLPIANWPSPIWCSSLSKYSLKSDCRKGKQHFLGRAILLSSSFSQGMPSQQSLCRFKSCANILLSIISQANNNPTIFNFPFEMDDLYAPLKWSLVKSFYYPYKLFLMLFPASWP